MRTVPCHIFFFFNDTATTEIYTLSLHDALPISAGPRACAAADSPIPAPPAPAPVTARRSEEHTSELQSPCNLVCRLLLEKKKITRMTAPAESVHGSLLLVDRTVCMVCVCTTHET